MQTQHGRREVVCADAPWSSQIYMGHRATERCERRQRPCGSHAGAAMRVLPFLLDARSISDETSDGTDASCSQARRGRGRKFEEGNNNRTFPWAHANLIIFLREVLTGRRSLSAGREGPRHVDNVLLSPAAASAARCRERRARRVRGRRRLWSAGRQYAGSAARRGASADRRRLPSGGRQEIVWSGVHQSNCSAIFLSRLSRGVSKHQ